jgi:ubiquinone/menaquinone biosynthesis C-methylase UbiE
VSRDPGAVHPSAARGFDRAGADYERGRPGYPDEAVALLARELGIGPGRRVLDLAAGTGKLTRALLPYGAQLRAIEPVRGMREQLLNTTAGVEVTDGTAEQIGLPDASIDVVLVAQAFHWFDTAAAAAEIHRVLVPGGGLGSSGIPGTSPCPG